MLHETVRPGSEKARIWQICDELFAKRGSMPAGREVVDIYMSEGGNEGTGFTQYSHWKRALADCDEANSRPTDGSDSVGFVGFRTLNISADGVLRLPPDIRRAMLLDSDGRITVHVQNGELTVISPMVALQRLQQQAKTLVTGGQLVSEELIAERRAKAETE